jgi:fatty-acyl-CoA synthase
MDIDYLLRQPFGSTTRFDPDSPALHFGDEASLSYRQVASRSRQLARGLIAQGVKPGDRVALLLVNSLDYWVCYFAITRIGAIVVRLNFRLSGEELEYALNDSSALMAICDADLFERVADRTERIGVSIWVHRDRKPDHLSLDELFVDDESPLALELPATSDAAMIMYTSGTTGRPKGAVWTHGGTTWFCAMQALEWGLGPDTVMFVAGPLYHVGAMEDYSLPTLAMGGQVVFLPSGSFDITSALTIASKRGVTDLTLFPSMIYQMLQLADLGSIPLTQVRRIFTGGDPLLPWAVERIHEVFPGVDVVQVYGLTEGTPIAACGGPGMAFEDPGSVGRAMPFCEIAIRDDDGSPLPDGRAGEIWTRSAANAIEYWNKPEATAETFIDGWCRTGDLGSVTSGRLTVTGRKKDMIRSGGENIFAREVEDVLMRHPDIIDAAVIAVPDAKYQEAVCAVLVLRTGAQLDAGDVQAHCSASIAGYKRPKYVVFVEALPRTASQKIQKFRLREQYAHLGSILGI